MISKYNHHILALIWFKGGSRKLNTPYFFGPGGLTLRSGCVSLGGGCSQAEQAHLWVEVEQGISGLAIQVAGSILSPFCSSPDVHLVLGSNCDSLMN